MTLTTTFVNKTTVAFKLKEGNAGIYKEVGTLEGLSALTEEPTIANKKTLEFDTRSTYKEYRAVFTAQSGHESARISIRSNEVLEYGTIYIIQDPKNAQAYIIDGEKRLENPLVPNWFVRIFQKVFKK